jgi:hypothetical protein
VPAAAEPDLEAALGERTRVGNLAVEPAHEIVDDLGARALPEHRRAAETARGDGVELRVGDLSQAALKILTGLAEKVLWRVLAEEALEDLVDRRPARERVEFDDLLGVLDRLYPEKPFHEEAIGARCVCLEDARAERRACREPGPDRVDRFHVGQGAVEGCQRSLSPACAAERVGSQCGRREAVEQRGPEGWVLLEDGDVPFGECQRADGVVCADATGEEPAVHARVQLGDLVGAQASSGEG